MDDIGSPIATRGWRQGRVLRDRDFAALAKEMGLDGGQDDEVAVVVSQSCDLTHAQLAGEPVAEILIGRFIDACAGDYMYGKHPRCLQMAMQVPDGGQITVEFAPWRRAQIDRSMLVNLQPDDSRFLLRQDVQILAIWLAQRYRRAALPDAFNLRVRQVRKKWEKAEKKLSPHVSGLYVRLFPDGEIAEDQQYRVNLLALVPVDAADALAEVEQGVLRLADLLQSTGMIVKPAAALEDGVPYATIRRMVRFPVEHLSLRDEPAHPLPREYESE